MRTDTGSNPDGINIAVAAAVGRFGVKSAWDERRIKATLEVCFRDWDARTAALSEITIDCGRSDYVMVDQYDRVTEFEIKTNIQDWHADYEKRRWHVERPYLHAFYWVFPDDIAPTSEIYFAGPPDAGILLACCDHELDWLEIVREARPNPHALPAPHIRDDIERKRMLRNPCSYAAAA